MDDDSTDRTAIVREGRYRIVEGSTEAEFRLLVDDAADDASDGDGSDRGVPIEDTEIDDLYAVVSRFRSTYTDSDDDSSGVELECHECGKRWTYTGSDEQASCPNCETTVPVEGIGP
ncbi:hypothetical protein [Natrarchaeobius oligotrophus]|uniref:Uncharacterized protein n=1 Tax=Natrarchaeobius chitinivorans TaxID=1679083 RepID=A0A3N6PLF0_NATCH|nr:hypothetical protein [Natrarchaeobius chitinivorans]RQG99755.1 hypothetical protein EA472_13970 [Natrarchaeobius chitinivorans]